MALFHTRAPAATRARRLCLLAGLAAWGSVGAAYYAQHVLQMLPCPWCILQRILFLVVGAGLIGLAALPDVRDGATALARRALVVLTGAFALAGVAAALYQNRVASKSPSCDLTLADRIISGLGLDAQWPELFEVRASCADAAVDLFGVPFELWSLALFVALAGVAARRWTARQSD